MHWTDVGWVSLLLVLTGALIPVFQRLLDRSTEDGSHRSQSATESKQWEAFQNEKEEEEEV